MGWFVALKGCQSLDRVSSDGSREVKRGCARASPGRQDRVCRTTRSSRSLTGFRGSWSSADCSSGAWLDEEVTPLDKGSSGRGSQFSCRGPLVRLSPFGAVSTGDISTAVGSLAGLRMVSLSLALPFRLFSVVVVLSGPASLLAMWDDDEAVSFVFPFWAFWMSFSNPVIVACSLTMVASLLLTRCSACFLSVSLRLSVDFPRHFREVAQPQLNQWYNWFCGG